MSKFFVIVGCLLILVSAFPLAPELSEDSVILAVAICALAALFIAIGSLCDYTKKSKIAAGELAKKKGINAIYVKILGAHVIIYIISALIFCAGIAIVFVLESIFLKILIIISCVLISIFIAGVAYALGQARETQKIMSALLTDDENPFLLK